MNMTNSALEDLLPEIAAESSHAGEIQSSVQSESAPVDSSILVGQPVSASDCIRAVGADTSFASWAIDSSLSFLDLADLPPVQTANALRGIKEHAIRDKVQIANSVLVLAANYGSEKDNQELADACALYAEKMKTIIKRLCL